MYFCGWSYPDWVLCIFVGNHIQDWVLCIFVVDQIWIWSYIFLGDIDSGLSLWAIRSGLCLVFLWVVRFRLDLIYFCGLSDLDYVLIFVTD